MTQRKYIIIILILIIIGSVFFIFKTTTKSTENKNLVGYIDMSAENKAKVCKDPTCTNPKPGIIDFEVSNQAPLMIDSENNISGKIFGDELGWITFNPSQGGVYLDASTGLLKGMASSETSDIINFEVKGQKVIIDPNTGEWNGWAWASGPYGGWIKFDCKDHSCVRVKWEEI
ncbi:MAG: hypothetical protein WC822_04315 [Candidatus Paceibacterota bacterium]|jgi:hypothetical protein